MFHELQTQHHCKVIFSYDYGMFSFISKYYFGRCKNISLNAGSYIGFARDLLDMITKIYNLNPKDDADDQVLATQYCNLYPNDIYIDTQSKLFLSIANPLQEIDNYVNINPNGTTQEVLYQPNQHLFQFLLPNGADDNTLSKPFFIHGLGSTYLDNILIQLGYKVEPNKIKNELFENRFRKITNQFIIPNSTIILHYIAILLVALVGISIIGLIIYVCYGYLSNIFFDFITQKRKRKTL